MSRLRVGKVSPNVVMVNPVHGNDSFVGWVTGGGRAFFRRPDEDSIQPAWNRAMNYAQKRVWMNRVDKAWIKFGGRPMFG